MMIISDEVFVSRRVFFEVYYHDHLDRGLY